ncbi:sodium-coupled transporter [Halorubrum sp. 48-1-W]|uniref:SLC13 family permease n=1 Tax=Halorubrum sp. 48-1-W TaxID=2249761 RepID=UPI000DCB6F8D|nr:SLC13 family permease [Halorubrum sp. 48-1-W]RAW43934.1 sodium-coupled transporter [Halorubrum sp. 48-1-W]
MSPLYSLFLWNNSSPLQQLPVQLPVSLDVVVVLAIIAIVFVLFVTQPVPIDATAVGLMVALVLLGEWTGVSPEQGVSGFSNPATLTVLAMFVLSEGVRRTGVIQILTRKLIAFAGDNEFRQLLATVTLSGPPGGVVSNVSVVAVLIPAIMNLARQTKTSPSKLLIPLSFASMLGGMLTVVGTITNLLASEVWVQVGGPDAQPFSLLEFTHLGAIVLLVGIVYLLTVGRYLTPERIKPAESPTDAFGMTDYLTDVVVMEDSPLVGSRVGELSEEDLDLDVFQIVRGNRTLARGLGSERIQAGDVLSVRADQETLQEVIEHDHLQLLPEVMEAATEDDVPLPPGFSPRRHGWGSLDAERSDSLAQDEASNEDTEEDGDETAEEDGDETAEEDGDETAEEDGDETAEEDGDETAEEDGDEEAEEDGEETAEEDGDGEIELTEVVLLPGAWSSRRSAVADFESDYDVTVLAIRRGDEVIRQRLREVRLQAGDVILVKAPDQVIDRIARDKNVAIAGEGRWEDFDRSKIPIALGILAGSLGLAALDVLTLMVSALTGVAAMFFTGILTPEDAYEAIDWEVIFMVAGVIPLGIAVEASGTADLIADLVVSAGVLLPVIAVLGLFYLGTAVITEMVSNSASVVLLLPIGVEVASQLGANPFAFAMAVTFAASTPLLTPVGYQTNLMVYGPGGYKFTDFARVGAPLQLILTVVTTVGIVFFWGV